MSISPYRLSPIVPAVLAALVICCDLALNSVSGIAASGALDEPAHLATASVVLLAFCRVPWMVSHPRELLVVLACAVLVDVDHIPLYLGLEQVAIGGRPFSHSLATALLLLVLSAVLPSRWRHWSLAAACGVGLHFVRDIATGPGLLLFWPLSDEEILLPHSWYAATVVCLALVATLRLWRAVKKGWFYRAARSELG